MEKSSTTRTQRIMIWAITIALVVGTLGVYFLIILQTNSQPTQTATSTQQTNEPGGTVDPTAYKVSGKVSQLEVTDLRAGTGAEVKAGDTVQVKYKGTIAQTGVLFDSSYERGEPATFSLNGVITGWSVGMEGMKVGGKRRLVIPSDMAYGPTGKDPIPPNTDLVFEVELLAIPAQ